MELSTVGSEVADVETSQLTRLQPVDNGIVRVACVDGVPETVAVTVADVPAAGVIVGVDGADVVDSGVAVAVGVGVLLAVFVAEAVAVEVVVLVGVAVGVNVVVAVLVAVGVGTSDTASVAVIVVAAVPIPVTLMLDVAPLHRLLLGTVSGVNAVLLLHPEKVSPQSSRFEFVVESNCCPFDPSASITTRP